MSTSRPSPPGKSRLKTWSKAARTSSHASVKTCSTRSSTSLTMSRRSLRVRRRSSSCSLRNLWRSSSAENSSSASGFTLPSVASARSAARSRFCCSSRTNGTGSPSWVSPVGVRRRRTGTGRCGPKSATRASSVEPELLQRPLLELLEPHPLLGAGHLVAVDAADQLVELAVRGRAASPGPRAAPPPGSGGGSRRPHARPPPRRWSSPAGPSTTSTPAATARATSPSRRTRSRWASARARASRSCWAARTSESARPASARARSSAVRRASRASVSAARAARAASASSSRVSTSGSSSSDSCAAASRCSSSASPARSASRASSAAAIAVASRSASPLADRACEPCWASSSAIAARWASDSCSLRQRHVDPLLGLVALLLEPVQLEGEPLAGVGDRGELLGRLVDGGLDLEQARHRRRPARREVRADQVAVRG